MSNSIKAAPSESYAAFVHAWNNVGNFAIESARFTDDFSPEGQSDKYQGILLTSTEHREIIEWQHTRRVADSQRRSMSLSEWIDAENGIHHDNTPERLEYLNFFS